VSADGSINTHNDVETVSPAIGDLLAWDGVNWVNIPATVGITPSQASAIVANTAKVSADGSINTHSDVDTTSPSIGDSLKWNGSQWVNSSLPFYSTVYNRTHLPVLYSVPVVSPSAVNALDLPLLTTVFTVLKVFQEVEICVQICYEFLQAGAFYITINDFEVGSSNTIPRINGIVPTVSAGSQAVTSPVGLRSSTFECRPSIYNFPTIGSYTVKVGVRWLNQPPDESSPFALNRTINDPSNSGVCGASSVTIKTYN
jgi:hypothetical protein